ncbi:MAG TPA: MBL fold metallo-hydrolase, partial [Chthoniobacterales bacterium]|nr:MBL fold metallo-hydrolase [Chthoniobacterales bacterium]
MAIPLEDNFTDVIGKAQRGLRISDSELAQQAGLVPAQIREVREGKIDNEALKKIAPVLRLDANALVEL